MRLLSIETSSPCGSVCLWEDGREIASLEHSDPHAHGERILPMVIQLLGMTGWARSSIDRIAVGRGPGSFTGVRVGLSLAQGLGLALGRPVIGVGSLAAMAACTPSSEARHRWCVLDAKREEAFLGVFTQDGTVLVPPCLLPVATLRSLWASSADGDGDNGAVVVGRDGPLLVPGARPLIASPRTQLPHAAGAALIGESLDPTDHPALPAYLREPDAIRPTLHPNPLAAPADWLVDVAPPLGYSGPAPR